MLLNLMLAVIMEQYVNGENEETNNKDEEEALTKEKLEWEKRIEKNKNMKEYRKLNSVLNKQHVKIKSILGKRFKNEISKLKVI